MSLTDLLARFSADFGLTVVAASEIEFYLHGSDGGSVDAWRADVSARCLEAGITIHKIEKERGREQHEISLQPEDALKMVSDTTTLKNIISEAAAKQNFVADFSAKPSADQPGSGLHIHIHLADSTGKNIYFKNDGQMSQALAYSIGGLLAWLPRSMPIFVPTPESYARFVADSNAPTTVSWGANNRTVAIRLPDKAHDNKHIEHRVAGADADPAAVIHIILEAIFDGLKNRTMPESPQIYGDARLASYGLPLLKPVS